ncbi:MAG: hypothetical protein ACE5MH_04490 [Terriglobia bacterium]
MTKKINILLAGVFGGVTLFLWGALFHMVLPLSEVVIKEIPNEEPVLATLRDTIHEPGFYFIPGMGRSPGMSEEQQQAATRQWEEKYRAGPTGILVYHPEGREPLAPKELVIQLLSSIAAALIAAFLLAQAVGGLAGFGARVLFVALLGLFATLVSDVPYWNWYRFPTDYTLAVLADHVIGWGLAGTVLAWNLKPAP